jgi:hypothetical protein
MRTSSTILLGLSNKAFLEHVEEFKEICDWHLGQPDSDLMPTKIDMRKNLEKYILAHKELIDRICMKRNKKQVK